MRLFFTVFLNIFLLGVSFAQSKEAELDSAYILVWESDSLTQYDLDKAYQKAEIGLSLSKKWNDPWMLGYSYYQFGVVHYFMDKPNKSLEYLNLAEKYYNKTEDSSGLSFTYYSQANVYSYLNQYSKAIKLMSKSTQIDFALGDSVGQLSTLSNIANLLYEQGDVLAAENKYRDIIVKADRLDAQYEKAEAIAGLLYCLVDRNKVQEVKQIIPAYRRLRKYKNTLLDSIYDAQLEALIACRLNLHQEAVEQAEIAYQKAVAYGDDYVLIEILSTLSEIHRKHEAYEKALTYAEDAIEKSKSFNSYYLNTITYRAATLAAEGVKHYKDALTYQRLLNAYEDSITHERVSEQLLTQSLNLKSEQTKVLAKENKLSNEIIKQQNTIRFALVVGLSLIVIVFVLGIFSWRSIKRSNKLLKKQNRKIAEQRKDLDEAYLKLQQNTDLLNKQNANKDKVFSILSHDLREPFNQLLGLISLLEHENSVDEETFKLIIPNLKQSTENAQSVVVNLLLWSKNQLSEIKVEKEEFLIESLITHLHKNFTLTLENKKIKLTREIEDNLKLNADYYQTEIAVRNLISNAVKFSPENSAIHVKAYSNHANVIIEVHDEGIGLSDDRIEQILEETMITVSTQGTYNERGTGLGLNIVADFVQANGGKLDIKSEVNKGSTFILIYPKA